MSRIRVCIAGVTGWVGRALVPAVVESGDLKLVGAVSRSFAGRKVSDAIPGVESHLEIVSSVEEALGAETDVLVDYTSPEVVWSNVMTAVRRGVNAVVGTSGLTDSDYIDIEKEATGGGVGVIAAGNFAISAALMLRFSTLAAKYLPSWEIIDYASDRKIDSPSGTARELAYRMSRVKLPGVSVPVERMVGPRDSRGTDLNGVRVHSVRLPGHVIGTDVAFGGEDERLNIRYESGSSPQPYIEGTLLAVRRVAEITGLIRGLDNLLDM